jgi:hypothetical protein
MKRGAMFLKCIIAVTVGILFFGWIAYLLWNWLVPVLFGGPVLSYWQALGLLLLTKILFFGITGGRNWSARSGPHQRYWKHRFYEKMSSLTPEEREAFKKKMREKWCAPREKGQE